MEGEQLVFSLVLESQVRRWLIKERTSRKHGKNRKLTKKELAEVEEQLKLCRFNSPVLTAAARVAAATRVAQAQAQEVPDVVIATPVSPPAAEPPATPSSSQGSVDSSFEFPPPSEADKQELRERNYSE